MKIIIHPDVNAGSPTPVHLNINGVSVDLPVGQEIDVTDEQFLALGHSDHTIEITVEGEPEAADETEQAPAPAVDDGGDAGGGGDSGDAPTDILPADVAGAAQADPALVESAQADAPQADAEQAAGDQAAAEGDAQAEQEAPAADDTLELGAGDEVEQPAADAQGDAQANQADTVEQTPETAAEGTAGAELGAGEETPLEKLQHGVDLEQEAIDELKQQGGQA